MSMVTTTEKSRIKPRDAIELVFSILALFSVDLISFYIEARNEGSIWASYRVVCRKIDGINLFTITKTGELVQEYLSCKT